MLYGLDEEDYIEDDESIFITNGIPSYISLVVTPDDRVWRVSEPVKSDLYPDVAFDERRCGHPITPTT